MANPTTNYGWPMPTSTDLVTDLPADFALFGQPVDTSLKALNPETTLGDIAYRSSTSNTNTRLGIGTNGQVLAVSSGVPAWTTTADVTPLTTKGDVFTFSTVDARIGVGANNTVLTADSAEATGLKWATASSSLTSQSANLAADVTMTSANTYYDGATITLAAGTWFIVANIFLHDAASTLPGAMGAKLWDGTTVSSSLEFRGGAALGVTGTLSAIVVPTTSTTYKISGVSSGASAVIKAAQISNGSGNNAGHISAVKIA